MEKWLLILLILPLSLGAVIDADSCSQTDVQAAVDSAGEGDTVLVPAGSCEWDTTTSINQGIVLKGAGQASSTGTIITAKNSALFNVILGSGDFRLTNFGFTGTGSSLGLETTLMRFGGTAYEGIGGGIWDSLRIDHCSFTNNMPGQYAMVIGAWDTFSSSPALLIDHITYTSNSYAYFVKLWGNNGAWQQDDNLGTKEAIFIEDSSFSWADGITAHITDTESGVRMVIRNNIGKNAQIQMHDTGSTQGLRGNRIAEIYNNDFSVGCTGGGECGNWPGMGFRGGTGVMYGNVIGPGYWKRITQQVWSGSGGSTGVCNVNDYKRWSDNRGDMGCCDNIDERICSTLKGHCTDGKSCNFNSDCGIATPCAWHCTIDSECGLGNTCLARMDNVNGENDPSGWPCRDQNGRGMDSMDSTTQLLSPIFIWDNEDENQNVLSFNENDNFLKPGRDYYNNIVVYNQSTKIYESSYLDDDNTIKPWRYVPYIYPHPLTIAQFDAKICEEGTILDECWCEGIRNEGLCEHGSYNSQECHEIQFHELISIVDGWRAGTKNINEVMQSIKQWKNGC